MTAARIFTSFVLPGRIVIQIAITNEQTAVAVDELRLRAALEAVLSNSGRRQGTISVAIVDDRTIHALNQRHLAHDYPTDVLSFVLEEGADMIDGEIIVSGERAVATAPAYGWAAEDELLLYVIHGALHLAGFDDKQPADAARMRHQEALHLAAFGLKPHNRAAAAGSGTAHAKRQSKQLTGEGSSP